jgi:hypothetical protein
MKKEDGAAVDSSAILPYLSSAGRATAFVGQNGQSNRDVSKPLGNTHKIPEKTNCRRDRNFQSSD